jgi:hypothetical protein
VDRRQAVAEFREAAIAKHDHRRPVATGMAMRRMFAARAFLFGLGIEGAQAFRALLDDDAPSVCLEAAIQLLGRGDRSALAVLEALVKRGGMIGLHAEQALAEWRGRDNPFHGSTPG